VHPPARPQDDPSTPPDPGDSPGGDTRDPEATSLDHAVELIDDLGDPLLRAELDGARRRIARLEAELLAVGDELAESEALVETLREQLAISERVVVRSCACRDLMIDDLKRRLHEATAKDAPDWSRALDIVEITSLKKQNADLKHRLAEAIALVAHYQRLETK
jgi:hypothetical protein